MSPKYALLLAPALALAACAGPPPAAPTAAPPWTYEDAAGPGAWGALSDAYAACAEGREQSPVALRTGSATAADLPELRFDYGPAALEVDDDPPGLDLEDTGYGYKATPTGSHALRIGGDTYRLVQFHPHTPSEHTVDGELFPMTLHFVHQNDDGELAVVGVMVREGAENEAYRPLVEAVAGAEGGAVRTGPLGALLPADRSYFTYEGSLTTPPCTEGVRWIVLREPVALSEGQVGVFERWGETNRPLQPLGDRTVRVSR